MEVKVKGLKELELALDQLPEKIARNILRSALSQGAKQIAKSAVDKVPVNTGRLRDSIRFGSGKDHTTKAPKAYVRAGGDGKKYRAYHANLVEFGTDHTPAQPFMRPAMDAAHAQALQAVADKLRQRLTKEGIEIPDSEPEDKETPAA